MWEFHIKRKYVDTAGRSSRNRDSSVLLPYNTIVLSDNIYIEVT